MLDPRPVLLLLVLLVGACRSVVPGDTPEEQRAHIDAWEQETLEMLYAQHPEARAEVAEAAGYLAVHQRVLKVPIFGGGSGYGVVVDRTRERRAYVRLDRMDVGGGLGTRNLRVVAVVSDPKLLEPKRSHWSFGGGAEAAAKSGESGAAGGAGAGAGKGGTKIYEMTEEGVSVTWTVYAIKLSLLRGLEEGGE